MDLYGVVQFVFCLLINCSDDQPTREVTMRTSIEEVTTRTSIEEVTMRTSMEERVNATTAATPVTFATTTTLPSFNHTEDVNVADNELDLTNDIRRRRGLEIQQEELRTAADDTTQPQENGAHCKFNQDCLSGCCLAATREERRCSSLSVLRDQCETAQIKGGFYADFCPCSAGDGACVGVAKGQRQLFCSQ